MACVHFLSPYALGVRNALDSTSKVNYRMRYGYSKAESKADSKAGREHILICTLIPSYESAKTVRLRQHTMPLQGLDDLDMTK